MPFEELPHTADWAVRVWSEDLHGLLAESVQAVNTLSELNLAAGPCLNRRLELQAEDAESLLVSFLSEIVYLMEQESLGVQSLHVRRLDGDGPFWLEVELECAAIQSVNKFIKAVTYHNLQIRPTERGLEVEIVFDV
jgi:SHS2 domain-containing protein